MENVILYKDYVCTLSEITLGTEIIIEIRGKKELSTKQSTTSACHLKRAVTLYHVD